jgi:FkbM family methyltransferase
MIDCEFKGHKFKFENTKTAPTLITEIFSDNYKILEKGITPAQGNVVLDIGANEGIFAIWLSKLFPQTRIIAFEPVKRTFNTLCNNVHTNACLNIECVNKGIGAASGTVKLNISKDYSGGSSALCTFNPENEYQEETTITTLTDVFKLFIGQCCLLKMDIEGMEYEALYAFQQFERIDYLTAEFHMNRRLDYQGRRVDGLVNWVSQRTNLIHVDICKMAD